MGDFQKLVQLLLLGLEETGKRLPDSILLHVCSSKRPSNSPVARYLDPWNPRGGGNVFLPPNFGSSQSDCGIME